MLDTSLLSVTFRSSWSPLSHAHTNAHAHKHNGIEDRLTFKHAVIRDKVNMLEGNKTLESERKLGRIYRVTEGLQNNREQSYGL